LYHLKPPVSGFITILSDYVRNLPPKLIVMKNFVTKNIKILKKLSKGKIG